MEDNPIDIEFVPKFFIIYVVKDIVVVICTPCWTSARSEKTIKFFYVHTFNKLEIFFFVGYVFSLGSNEINKAEMIPEIILNKQIICIPIFS